MPPSKALRETRPLPLPPALIETSTKRSPLLLSPAPCRPAPLPSQGFYHELHRPSHFLNFTSMEDVEQAAEADHEDFFQ